eukprot:10076854-Alexandrium_andersonii.AAC.1
MSSSIAKFANVPGISNNNRAHHRPNKQYDKPREQRWRMFRTTDALENTVLVLHSFTHSPTRYLLTRSPGLIRQFST